MFFRAFDEEVRKIFNEDKDKYLVMSWIIFKTNYQDEYNGLKENQCYFSYSVIEEELSINHRQMLKIIKELEKNSFISWEFKSKTKYKKSILNLLNGRTSKCTDERTSKGTSKTIENTNVIDDSVLVNEPVNVLSSRNSISKNISNNIYSDKKEVPKEYIEIFDYWNSLKIVKHTKITPGIEKAIKKALKEYDINTIKIGIKNYNRIIKDDSYYFNYKWTLENFLTRAKGIKEFLEEGQQYINYSSNVKTSSIAPIRKPLVSDNFD